MIQPHGLILMGGRATRMGGGDKGLLPLGDTTILGHVLDRLAPQVDRVALNANGDPARLAHLNLPVLPDGLPDHPGPLAGTLAGLDWAASLGATHIVTAAADTPFLPCDLVPQLLLAGGGSGFALAASPGGRQPTFGLWPVALRDALRTALNDGLRKIVQFTRAHGAGTAAFPDDAAFFNVNTPDDLVTARAML
ncbi:molybdenum cofactor guanylyltransferase [Loktanella atrilutea]|uniref:Molybdenum cofactor guanylyltransferase n=1 Tax=Loktanella atrilutea TaxID=366533 RepID=A0A1M5BUC0_LOKAT|nr:molybdenum cofactor guanylyltransferase MobA [Loktanella atrilutea]SHF45822.1 molybdenum cofactor guanylyltransferase [Loktanella atrilutea]